jgi:hypothetical protein
MCLRDVQDLAVGVQREALRGLVQDVERPPQRRRQHERSFEDSAGAQPDGDAAELVGDAERGERPRRGVGVLIDDDRGERRAREEARLPVDVGRNERGLFLEDVLDRGERREEQRARDVLSLGVNLRADALDGDA